MVQADAETGNARGVRVMATTVEGSLVEQARAGDQRAFGQLFDQWFDRVHDLSRRIVHDDGIAGEIAQDTFLTAWTKLSSLEDPDAFGGWLLRIARNGSLNRLAKERRAVTLDDETMTAVADASAPDHDPLERMDQAARISLVWDAAAALGPRDASVLDLHLRHGLSATELADELGVTANNAHQVLFTMRKRLANAVRALVLWRAGHPTCPDLRQGLAAAGLTSFGGPMVKAIDRHVDGCLNCSDDRTERLAPSALFAAAPIVAASLFIKSGAASGLAASGVPMSGSTAAAPAGAGGGATPGGESGAGGTGGLPPEPPAARSALARRRMLVTAAIVLVVGLAAVLFAVASADVNKIVTAARPALPIDLERSLPTTTTGPTGTAAGPTRPEVPGTTPASDAGPTATAPAATQPAPTTSTAPAPPAPVIDQFEATPTATPCANEDVEWAITWATTGADTVALGRADGPTQPVEPSSKTTICAPSGMTFILVAIGPGGETRGTAGGGVAPTTTTTGTTIG